MTTEEIIKEAEQVVKQVVKPGVNRMDSLLILACANSVLQAALSNAAFKIINKPDIERHNPNGGCGCHE